MKDKPTRYSQVEMPADLMGRVDSIARSRHHTAAGLARSWLAMAGRFALDGRTDMLPEPGAVDRGSGGFVNLQWAETREDSAETVRLLKAAGTTRPAVLIACFRAYVEAGGSLVRMNWPRREAVQGAAA